MNRWATCGRRMSSGKLDAVMFLLVSLLTTVAMGQASTDVQMEFLHAGDTTHLELKGMPTWNYAVKRDESSKLPIIYLDLPTLSQKATRNVLGWKSPFVEKVEVDSARSTGERTVLAFYLTRQDIQTFDYQVESPSQLILDFFVKDADSTKSVTATKTKNIEKATPGAAGEPTGATAAPTAKTNNNLTSDASNAAVPTPSGKQAKKVAAKTDRKPASDIPPQAEPEKKSMGLPQSGVFDGSDPNYERFAIKNYQIKPENMVQAKRNIYLEFPMLQLPYQEVDDIISAQPVYQILPSEGGENEQARFLVALFHRKRFAAFQKAYKVFKKKFPQTRYNEILEYLFADIHMDSFKSTKSDVDFEIAVNTYMELMMRYPQSAMYDRTAILVANAYWQKKEYVRALRMYQKYLNDRPQSPHSDVVRLVIAHTFAALNQFQDATNVLRKLSSDARQPKYAAEAMFRLGDAAFVQKKWVQAVELYQETLVKKPADIPLFPNIYFNLAESQFWLGQYADSAESYRSHLKQFPSHPFGGYALIRLGELIDILTGDKQRANAAYLESYFRFSPSTGAKVARIRLLTQRFRDMKKNEFLAAVKEISAIGEQNEVPGMQEFVTLALTDALNDRGESKDATQRLITYYQANPTSLTLPVIKTRIERNYVNEIKALISKGEFLSGLDLFEKHSTFWIKGVNRRDLEFHLALAFEKAGVNEEAYQKYEALLKKLESGNTATKESQGSVFDNPPALDQVHLRMARVQFEAGHFAQAVDHLKKIKGEQNLTDQEKVERVEIASRVFQKTGQHDIAVQMLTQIIDTWKDRPELITSALYQRAQVYVLQDKHEEALKSLDQLLGSYEKNSESNPKDVVAAMKLAAESNLKLNRADKAIEIMNLALEKYESKIPMPETRYRLGLSYFEQGNLKQAEQVWEKLNPTDSKVWYQMAQEQMKQDKFKANYRKYIDRIPAMSDLRQSGSGGKL